MGPKEELTFFDPWSEIAQTRNLLPHWQQPGATYFITFRMADSIPATLRSEWDADRKSWCELHPKPWNEATKAEYHHRFSAATERWLDVGHGSCFLRSPEPRQIVSDALRHFDADRYALHSTVAMPNHVHVLASLSPSHSLESVLHSWKSYTAHAITKRHPEAPNPFWQEDYYDRLVRNAEHFHASVRYIRNNPVKAKLPPGAYDLYESPLAQQTD